MSVWPTLIRSSPDAATASTTMQAAAVAAGRRVASPSARERTRRPPRRAAGSSAPRSDGTSRPGCSGQKTAPPRMASRAGMSVTATQSAMSTARPSPGPKVWKKPSRATSSPELAVATVIAAATMVPVISPAARSAAACGEAPSARRSRKRDR